LGGCRGPTRGHPLVHPLALVTECRLRSESTQADVVSLARSRAPRNSSRCFSIRYCSDFSTATNVPVSYVAATSAMRNSLMSLMRKPPTSYITIGVKPGVDKLGCSRSELGHARRLAHSSSPRTFGLAWTKHAATVPRRLWPTTGHYQQSQHYARGSHTPFFRSLGAKRLTTVNGVGIGDAIRFHQVLHCGPQQRSNLRQSVPWLHHVPPPETSALHRSL
jgi:hypothetical protein